MSQFYFRGRTGKRAPYSVLCRFGGWLCKVCNDFGHFNVVVWGGSFSQFIDILHLEDWCLHSWRLATSGIATPSFRFIGNPLVFLPDNNREMDFSTRHSFLLLLVSKWSAFIVLNKAKFLLRIFLCREFRGWSILLFFWKEMSFKVHVEVQDRTYSRS